MFLRKKKNKHYVTLLEVLIAFSLVVFCLIPLLHPHVAMVKLQSEFLQKIKLDHAINVMTGQIVEKLYKNEIPWSVIEDERPMPIDPELWQGTGASTPPYFKGMYQFHVVKMKPKKNEEFKESAWLVKLKFFFLPGPNEHLFTEYSDAKNRLQYSVDIFIKRDNKSATQPLQVEHAPPKNQA